MGDEVGIEPVGVYAAGQRVASFAADANGLASLYASRLDTAAGTVHHRSVAAAVDRYRAQWLPFVREVAYEVAALGQNTSTVSVVITDADQDAAGLLARSTGAQGAQGSTLARPINADSAVI